MRALSEGRQKPEVARCGRKCGGCRDKGDFPLRRKACLEDLSDVTVSLLGRIQIEEIRRPDATRKKIIYFVSANRG